jgi:hypothetical protein
MPLPAGARAVASPGTEEFRKSAFSSGTAADARQVQPRAAAWTIVLYALRLLVLTAFAIFAWSRSLLLTSAPIDAAQRVVVLEAIRKLDDAGFSNEVLVLRHFANFRATDNWWNRHVGHSDAYAATNFPLGVVTLYPRFFNVTVDATERAAILLHEARHLWGDGETAALEAVWREKQRLGWTAERYADTRVFRNTREWTAFAAPWLVRD